MHMHLQGTTNSNGGKNHVLVRTGGGLCHTTPSARLVVKWMTISEHGLLYVFLLGLFLFVVTGCLSGQRRFRNSPKLY